MKSSRLINRSFLIFLMMLSALLSYFPVVGQDIKDNKPSQSTQVFLPLITTGCGSCYYVDSINGSDNNPGNSINKPWKSLTPVNSMKFPPGSIIYFKRGSSWRGNLTIESSGVEGKPITYTTYGTGDKPTISNPSNSNVHTRAVIIYASWVIIQGLRVRDTYEAGIKIVSGADHNIVRDNEITNTGLGIQISGQHNLFTGNYVHDLHMVVNTPGGKDDYGAVGVLLSGSYNEIAFNKIINCKASSYDFGTDGGAVEWWSTADSNYVHNNWTKDNNGFLEVGGGSARNARVAYNVSINNGIFSSIHLTGQYASIVEHFQVVNNTIIENENNRKGWVVLGFDGNPGANTFLTTNNIFYIFNFTAISNSSSFTHDHNMYYLGNGTVLRFTLGAGEKMGNPLFVDITNQDFHLQPNSPAIDAGVDLGYSHDFENNPVPDTVGSGPDLGAYEYQDVP